MQKLVDALIAHAGKIVPFFRDMHLAYDFDLEPQLGRRVITARAGWCLRTEACRQDARGDNRYREVRFHRVSPLLRSGNVCRRHRRRS